MCLQPEYQNNLIFLREHSEGGQNLEKLNISDQMVQEESIMLTTSEECLESTKNPNLQSTTSCVMQESVLPIKKKILTYKLKCLNQNIQTQESSEILQVDSIGTDLDLIPFWKESTMGLSRKLWSPKKTDCVDLDLNLYNGSSKNLMQNSWFSARIQNAKQHLTSSQTTYLQSLQCLLPKITVLEQANIEEKEKKTPSLKPQIKLQAEKAIKVRIFPDKDQKTILNRWFGIRRFIYNKCIAIMKEDYKNQIKTTQKRLRELVVNNVNYIQNNTWMIEYEYDLRDEAMRDALKNLKSNLAKGGHFDLKFLSKKYDIGSLSVLSKKWNKKNNFYNKIFRPDKIKSTEILPTTLHYTSRLIKTRTKKYYFCLPLPLEQCENQAPTNSMIFIDPGVKTFITGYDPSGKIITWGENDIGRIARLLHYSRKLQSKIKKCNTSKKKKKYNLAFLRLKERIRHLTSELHKKLSKWLCSNYENIYIPKLNFHKCKNLNKKSKAKLAALSHCMFVDRLKNKTRQYSNTKLYEVNEAFTSKTCSNCGFQKEDLKNNNTYDCDSCHIKIGRDINASKNIMLRYFTKRALLKKQGVAS